MQWNFPEMVSTPRERSTSNLFRKKNESYACYKQSMKLTNRIAAFEKMQIAGSEGGRRPSERSDTILQMFYLSMATLCLLQAAYRTDQ
jgi:hypothetical protein